MFVLQLFSQPKEKIRKKHHQIHVFCVPGRSWFSLTVLDSHSKALEHCSAWGADQGVPEPCILPGPSKGCSQQDGYTQEGERLVLLWQLSSPSEEWESSSQQHLPGKGIWVIVCYKQPTAIILSKPRGFGFDFYPLFLYPLRFPNLKPWQSGHISVEPRDGRLGSWWAFMRGHPASKLGHLAEVMLLLLLAGGKSPPSIPAKQATAQDGAAPGQLPC